MSLDDVVTLTISRSAAAVSRQGFGTMLILGSNATGWNTDVIRSYTKASDMLTDGFSSGNAEYKAALAAFGQAVRPSKVKVGKRASAVAQVNTLTPDTSTQEVQHYIVTIDGTAYDFTSDSSPTAAEVVTGVNALVNGDSACAVAATGTTTVILTAKKAGIAFDVSVSANLANVATTPNTGVSTDLSGIQHVDDDWYALVLCSRDDDEIVEAAKWIEAQRKIFVACTSDSAVIAAGTTDVASRLKAKSYARTAYLYSGDQADMPEAAWLGNLLPLTPGSATYKFKTLAGITVDNLTATQQSVAQAKNANVYVPIGGVNITEEGVTADGEFIDVVVGVDWIHANMQADVYQALVDAPKIPYTDRGIGIIEQIIQNRLRLAVVAGILTEDPKPAVTVPLAADVDTGDKAARRLTGVSFTGKLAGAVHAVTITGNVSV